MAVWLAMYAATHHATEKKQHGTAAHYSTETGLLNKHCSIEVTSVRHLECTFNYQ